VKILSWNIRHGGGTRRRAIVDTIVGHEPDVVVLTEYQPGPGVQLCDDLRRNGWTHVETTTPAHRYNGVMVASRVPMTRRTPSADVANVAERWLEVEFPKQDFALAGVYLPTDHATLAQYWESVHEAAERRRSEHFLFVGDFNTGYAPFDAENGAFSSERYFCGMPMHGFTDAWRHRNGAKLDYSWYSHTRTERRNGFRIDHAFASASMLRRVRECAYSHPEREAGVSDHSSMLLQIH
jgi:exodeoxyribonuclease III